MLIALHEEGAWLRVRDGEDIFVDRYGAVVFRGDLTHAGAEWNGASYNWRIHLYFDTIGREWECKVPRKGREARGGRYITVIEPPEAPPPPRDRGRARGAGDRGRARGAGLRRV